jgi:hypothetical protein
LPVERGLQLGARIGYALPVGTIAQSNGAAHLSDLETASIPIGIDVGYRFTPHLYAGGTIAWGPGISPNSANTCPSPISCFRQNAELRLDARLYFARDGRVHWWTSGGAGWEVATFAQSNQGSTITSTLTGPVFANLQIGFEFQRGNQALGPYFGVAFAEFLSKGVNPSNPPVPTWLPDPGLHTWLTLGLRGSYGPW